MKDIAHIGTVIDDLLRTYRHDSDTEMSRIWSIWDGLVGADIAANARPSAFKGRLLLVHVTNSTWLHQLHFLKKDIIRKINDAFGKEIVEELKFKIGTI
jgi:predicted nucleic acid-binding Zn ribbon protein